MLIRLLPFSLYPWPELRSGMSLGKAGSPLWVWSHTHANTIVSWSGSSAAHCRIQPGFVVPVCVFHTNLRRGRVPGRTELALQWGTVNSFLTDFNFAQKSTLQYPSACLGHVNSSIRKIYFNSERKVTQRTRSLSPCWSDMLLVHWPLPNFLYMCMYLYLTMVVEKFSLLVFCFFKPFLWKMEDALETWFFFFLMACYVTVSGGSVVVS